MRKLVTMRTVSKIEPIPNADNIELAHVDGWKCIVKKGEFQVGQKGIYFEVDSFLPIKPEYEFLRKSSYRNTKNLGEGFRIRTMKMRGVVSQGLLIPTDKPFTEEDLTEKFEVKKFEPYVSEFVPKPQKPKSWWERIKSWFIRQVSFDTKFPSFIPKTDEERIQNVNLMDYSGKDFVVTRKLHGESTTVYSLGGQVHVCSRNLRKNPKHSSRWYDTAKEIGLIDALKKYPGNIALQGELMGPGIFDNELNLTKKNIYVFNAWDIDKREALPLSTTFSEFERTQVVPSTTSGIVTYLNSQGCNVEHVPFISYMYKMPVFSSKEEADAHREVLLGWANQTDYEGFVFRGLDGSKGFKVISNKWLLKNEDKDFGEAQDRS